MMERVRVLHELLSVIAPPVCAACGTALPRADGLVCGACLRDLPWIAGACPRCALPGHRNRPCPAANAPFDGARAPLAYEGPAKELVKALKFRGALPLASLMAAQMAVHAPPGGVIVPVPPSRTRLRERGFDPAALLARELAARTGAELQPLLRRLDRAGRQVGAPRAERRGEGRHRIELRADPPGAVVLVDDVHTTGATLAACARALRDGGAARVDALTYARTL